MGENILLPVIFVGGDVGSELPEGLNGGQNIFAPVVLGGLLPVVGACAGLNAWGNIFAPLVLGRVASSVVATVRAFCAFESVAWVACSGGFETLPNREDPPDVVGAVGFGGNASEEGPEPKEVNGLLCGGALLKTEVPPAVDEAFEPNGGFDWAGMPKRAAFGASARVLPSGVVCMASPDPPPLNIAGVCEDEAGVEGVAKGCC